MFAAVLAPSIFQQEHSVTGRHCRSPVSADSARVTEKSIALNARVWELVKITEEDDFIGDANEGANC